MAGKQYTFDVFPHEYIEREYDRQMQKTHEEQETVKKKAEERVAQAEKDKNRTMSSGTTLAAYAGMVVVLGPIPLLILTICYAVLTEADGYGYLLPPVLFYVTCLVISIVSGTIGHKQDKNIKARIDRETEAELKGMGQQMQQKINDDAKRYEEDGNRYLEAFNAAAIQQAALLADSPAVTAVAQWLVKMFADYIDQENRGSNVEKIELAFHYRVYRDYIGTFNNNSGPSFIFDEARLSNLKGPLQQAALARAVASAVQLELMMRYSTDPSGTVPTVNIVHSYDEKAFDHTLTQITYAAPNGNYQAARGWN